MAIHTQTATNHVQEENPNLITSAENIHGRLVTLVENIRNVADRLLGSAPTPIDGKTAGAPVQPSMSQTLESCHEWLSAAEYQIGRVENRL